MVVAVGNSIPQHSQWALLLLERLGVFTNLEFGSIQELVFISVLGDTMSKEILE